MDLRRVAEGTVVIAIGAAVVSVLTTWSRSGERDRNGLATLESLDRLDLLDPRWETALVVVSASLPLFLAVAAVGVAVDRPWLAGAGAVGGAVVLVAWAVVVLRSPLRAAPGPQLALLSALALLVTTGVTTRAQRRQS